jgi:hypothetical protein
MEEALTTQHVRDLRSLRGRSIVLYRLSGFLSSLRFSRGKCLFAFLSFTPQGGVLHIPEQDLRI